MDTQLDKSLNTKELYSWTLKLALPIMIQNLISTLVNTADTFMLGYVGQSAMAATSLANQYTFVLFCVFFGMATGTSVLCAQYWGKGDKNTIERIVGLALRYGLVASIIFTLGSFFFPAQIMKLFSSSPETIEIGAKYLRIVSISFIFMAISQVYLSALRSIGKVVFPSVVAVVSLVVNIFFNASFIFGFFGLPKLGVVGVALGTVLARITEAVLCICFSFKSGIRINIRAFFAPAGILNRDFLTISLPSIGNDLIWSLATTVFTIILGHLGDDIVAANAVAMMVVNIGAIAMRGFANATTIVIGQALGANQIEETKKYAGKLLRLTVYVSLAGCIVIVVLRPFIMNFYSSKLTAQAISFLGSMMFMTTYRMIGEGVNTCLICGCFRGGGDTKYGFIMDTIMMWGVAIPLMAIAAYVFKLPAIWVYFVMTLDEIIKMPIFFGHFLKYKWMKNITRNESELL
ncbi:MAG: MATE family efflux transporter [Treponema sp.]|nr:MATE family efflux transporter [Treponema sp.]